MDIVLHLTQDCQLRCSYCYGGSRRNARMEWEVAKSAIDFFFAANSSGSDQSEQICFFGGEPLLEYKLIQRCIEYVELMRSQSQKSPSLALNTNGLLLDEPILNYLLSKGVETVLSFDGVKESQDATRVYPNGSSCFEHVKRSMLVMTERIDHPTVCAVVSPENVAFLRETIDFFLDYHIERLFLNPNFFASWDDEHISLLIEGYHHGALRFEEAHRRGVPFNINLFTEKIVDHLRQDCESTEARHHGQLQLAIAPSGRIYICQYVVGNDDGEAGCIGNVFDGTWSELAMKLSEYMDDNATECLPCEIKHRCRRRRSTTNHPLTNRLIEASGFICFHERMITQLADEVATRLFAARNELFMSTFYSAMPPSEEQKACAYLKTI